MGFRDGPYRITLSDGDYRAEHIDNEWFLSDGTGWREKIPEGEAILNIVYIGDLPNI